MKENLLNTYNELCRKVGIEKQEEQKNINQSIRSSLYDFCNECKNPAIWCNGEHTQMLMADFVAQLKDVKYIVDDYCDEISESGYKIIRSTDILRYEIDGVIISSYKNKDVITNIVKEKFPNVKYLDIYHELEEKGLFCGGEYYLLNHPYKKYTRINNLLQKSDDEKSLYKLIRELIFIKDFVLAKTYIKRYCEYFGEEKIYEIAKLNDEILNLIKTAIKELNKSNVLLLCIDSLRKQDLDNGLMPKLKEFIDSNMESYENAYSISTSTYESIIPAFSENYDFRTKYYEKNNIEKDGCRFVNEALKQGKNIYFYTDAGFVVDNEHIKYSGKSQTASEKLWDFVVDSADEQNGLFYIHILYESHFSFSNPYTKEKLYASGTNMFFDLLEKNGGRLKADYEAQHMDSLRYLDDLLEDFVSNIKIPMVICADHGISIMPFESELEDIAPMMLVCEEAKIHIPFAYWNGESRKKRCNNLFSLGEINEVIISLMNNKRYEAPEVAYVKVQRSKIYNPDYQFIYKKLDFEIGGLAFEAFIFENKNKIIIYENGISDLYNEREEIVYDAVLKEKMLYKVLDRVTVCERSEIFKCL